MTTVLKIIGMMCEHCAARVKKGLEAVPGVTRADVSLEQKQACVEHDGLDCSVLKKTVEDLGYEAAC